MLLRHTNVKKLSSRVHDVFIVGCGINGAVSAAALASRGASVAMIDRGDFAGFTSQESSNLVWGGIKYLENYEFSLVWDLCESRNRLMEAYPSNIKEVRFFAALEPQFRFSPLFLTAGTWLYWLMGKGATHTPRFLSKARIAEDEPAVNVDAFKGGVEYSDAYLVDNDARFVFSFVRLALNMGAIVANYVELLSVKRGTDGLWHAVVRDNITGAESEVRSKVLVNAAGPFVDEINDAAKLKVAHRHVFSRGIHLVVPQITTSGRVLTFFDDTGRLFFVIPMGPRSVIGTTDTRVNSPHTHVTEEDRDFLLANVNRRLRLARPLDRSDIIAERCGVRPLVVEAGGGDDETAAWFNLSRKHVLEHGDHFVAMYGGKLTDCLNVGEEVVALVKNMDVDLEEDQGHRWFGEPSADIARAFFRQARLMRLDEIRTSVMQEKLSERLWRRYGLRAFAMLESLRRDPAMDDVVIDGADYLRCELFHAAQTEMITKLEDFLRRRSKIALVVPHHDLAKAEGLHEVCRMLFGDEAEAKYREYFDTHHDPIPTSGGPSSSGPSSSETEAVTKEGGITAAL